MFSIKDTLQRVIDISVGLDTKEINLIHIILEEFPADFSQKIDKHIQEILKDEKITLHDIPEIVLLFSTIFTESPAAAAAAAAGFDIYEFVDFLLRVLIEYGEVLPPDIDKIAASKIIDVALSLLKTVVSQPKSFWANLCCCCCARAPRS